MMNLDSLLQEPMSFTDALTHSYNSNTPGISKPDSGAIIDKTVPLLARDIASIDELGNHRAQGVMTDITLRLAMLNAILSRHLTFAERASLQEATHEVYRHLNKEKRDLVDAFMRKMVRELRSQSPFVDSIQNDEPITLPPPFGRSLPRDWQVQASRTSLDDRAIAMRLRLAETGDHEERLVIIERLRILAAHTPIAANALEEHLVRMNKPNSTSKASAKGGLKLPAIAPLPRPFRRNDPSFVPELPRKNDSRRWLTSPWAENADQLIELYGLAAFRDKLTSALLDQLKLFENNAFNAAHDFHPPPIHDPTEIWRLLESKDDLLAKMRQEGRSRVVTHRDINFADGLYSHAIGEGSIALFGGRAYNGAIAIGNAIAAGRGAFAQGQADSPKAGGAVALGVGAMATAMLNDAISIAIGDGLVAEWRLAVRPDKSIMRIVMNAPTAPEVVEKAVKKYASSFSRDLVEEITNKVLFILQQKIPGRKPR